MTRKGNAGGYYIRTIIGERRPIYAPTLDEAQAEHNKIKVALRNGSYIEKSSDTFKKLMESMLDEIEENGELKDNSLNRKRDTSNIVLEFIKCSEKQIKNISADELNKELKKLPNIKKFIQSKNREEFRFSQSYINKIYSLIRETFHYAVLKEKISKEQDPFEVEGKIKKPKSNKNTKVVKPFTRAECIRFLEELNKYDHKFINILKIQLFGGLRIGETLGLTSENIDLEQNKIFIETTITKNKANKFIRGDTTKTPTGTRSIPLTPILRDILEPLVNKEDPKALIFSNNGKPHNESNINRVMKQVCLRANIRVITINKKKADGRIANQTTSDITVHRIKTSLYFNRSFSKSRPKGITSLVTAIKTFR